MESEDRAATWWRYGKKTISDVIDTWCGNEDYT
jgi:hypothetical protein